MESLLSSLGAWSAAVLRILAHGFVRRGWPLLAAPAPAQLELPDRSRVGPARLQLLNDVHVSHAMFWNPVSVSKAVQGMADLGKPNRRQPHNNVQWCWHDVGLQET